MTTIRQSISQWRGGDVQNILNFDNRYPGVEQVPLEENFRSSEGIVETARVFVEQNGARLAKTMKPTGAQNCDAGDIVALSFAMSDDEAKCIADTTKSLRGVVFLEIGRERGLSWSDMAVLLRSALRNAEPITKALKSADIPFVWRTASQEKAHHALTGNSRAKTLEGIWSFGRFMRMQHPLIVIHRELHPA